MEQPTPSFAKFLSLLMIGLGLISVGVMFVIVTNDTTGSAQDYSAIPAKMNYPAPELTLTNLAGNTVSLEDYRGTVVLVNLWATWCPPCREEMPTLQKFYEKYKNDGFELIAINQEETLDVVQPFVDEFGLTFPVWLDLEYQAEKEFKTVNLPSSYVIDRTGQVRLLWIGGITYKRLQEFVPEIIME